MDTPRIESRVGVRASAERLWALLADLPGWSRWNPVEADIDGAIGFGAALTLTERLPGLAPRPARVVVRDWQPEAQLVWTEKRGLLFNAVRYLEIEALAPESCLFAHGLMLSGLRGELFFDRHRRTIRAAYDEAAENLRRLAEG